MTFNLFNALPDATHGECFEDLLSRPGCRIELIVSRGQVSPAGFWYEQGWDEWVLLLDGRAVLEFEDPANAHSWQVELTPGGYVLILKGQRHRVAFTQPDAVTIWLAVHITAG